MTTTETRRAIEDEIHNLTNLTEEELRLLEHLIERAYIHIMIERHLRTTSNRVS
jgi:hypothetical protein